MDDHTANSASIPSTSIHPSLSLPLPTNPERAPLLPTPSAVPRSQSTYGTTRSPTPSFLSRPPKRLLRTRCCLALFLNILVLCIWSLFVGVEQVESEVACGTCLGILIPLQALAHVGDDAFSRFFVQICTQLHIEDPDVCLGAVGSQSPILAHDLRSISLTSASAKHFCSTVFGLCPLPKVVEYNVALKPLELVNGTTGKVWKSRGRETLKVVHLSDVHIDREYLEGSDTSCSKNICCRDYGVGSLGPNISHPAGKFGNDHCDTPVDLVQSMLRAIDQHVPDKAFTIFTGDVVESAVWSTSQYSVENDLHLWNEEMQAPSYPVIGNHDVSPVNSFPRATTPLAPSSQWVFDLAASDWEKWIGRDAAEQVRRNSGCYAVVHPGTELKIISLNTQYWYKQNFWLYDSDEPQWDPNGILTWLASELHASERAGQRAWIIGHMPWGKVDAMRDQSNYANQIFQRYHNTIAAHFYGHSHLDEFEVDYSDYSNQSPQTANGIAYISGALTPASGNPVFRVYEIDPDTYEVMDFVPYYTNKSEASFQVDPVWKPYYSARASYGSYLHEQLRWDESLDGKFWHRVTEKMEKDPVLFELFVKRLSRGGKIELCGTEECKRKTICMLRSLRSENNCVSVRPGLSFKDKKPKLPLATASYELEDESPLETDACEGAGLGSLLRKLAGSGFGGDVWEMFETQAHESLGEERKSSIQ